jgi:carboxypeptidase D
LISWLKQGFTTEPRFEHHNFRQMESLLNSLAAKYPDISRLYSVGKSVQGRDLYVMEISDKPGEIETG